MIQLGMIFFGRLHLEWMVQCHKDVYQNSRLRLEYAYLLFNKFIMNRINSKLIEIGRILTSFSVTESSCDDTPRASKKKSAKQFWRNTRTNFVIILIINYGFVISKVTLKGHCKTTSKFGLFWLILSLSCSLWLYWQTGMHILTSVLNFCDTVPSLLTLKP